MASNHIDNLAADAPLNLWVPIHKSETMENGAIKIEGVFTDESVDYDDEIVKASEFPEAFSPVQKGVARFNYEHRDKIVGDVHGVEFISAEEARRRYPNAQKEFKGMCGVVKGIVHPMTEEASDDLRETRHLLKCNQQVGTPVGFSLQGKRLDQRFINMDGKRVSVTRPSFVPLISITALPKNANSYCQVAKSLRAMLAPGAPDVQVQEDAPEAVEFVAPNMFEADIAKDMNITDVKAQAGVQGADATKIEEGSPNDPRTKKKKCGCSVCPNCAGAELGKSLSNQLEDLKKAVRQVTNSNPRQSAAA